MSLQMFQVGGQIPRHTHTHSFVVAGEVWGRGVCVCLGGQECLCLWRQGGGGLLSDQFSSSELSFT